MGKHLSFGLLLGILSSVCFAPRESSAQPPENQKPVPIEVLIQQLKAKDYGTRYAAAAALERLGRQAEPAIPGLIDALGDLGAFNGSNIDFVFEIAARTLTTVGSPAIPALMAAVRDHPNDRVRNAALGVLGRIGRPAERAIPAVKEALRNDPLRVAAALALWRVAPNDPAKPILTLIDCLQHKGHDIRSAAARALGAIGPPAKEAIPALAVRLKDEDFTVRYSSATALGAMKEEGMPAVPVLLEALQDEHYYVRGRVIRALGEIGPHTTAAAIALGRELADSDASNSTDALRVLAGMGPDAEPVLPLLMDAIQSEGAFGFEANVLGRIGPNARAAVPGLIRAMKAPDRQFRSNLRLSATKAVGLIGPGARDAIPALIDALTDDWYEVEVAAVESLIQIGPEAVPALTAALRHPLAIVRGQVAAGLGRLGPIAHAAIPALREALKDDDDGVRSEAAAALRTIQPRKGGTGGATP